MVKRIIEKERNIPSRKIKNALVIAAEGKNKTESIYFSSFNRIQKSYHIHLAKGNKTDPEGIVKDMIRTIRNEDIDIASGDMAVCVFDTDFEEYKEKQINVARKLGQKYGIEIITSNPCFEIWFIEHFGYTSKVFGSNIEIFEELKKRIPDYSKSKDVLPLIFEKTDLAIENCIRLEKWHDSIGNIGLARNPSSDVYKIINTIRNNECS